MRILGWFFLGFLLAILNGYIFNLINDCWVKVEVNSFDEYSLPETILLVVFLAPLVETFFFQFLLFKLLADYLKITSNTMCIIIMSLVFSQAHWYHWLYVIMTFFSGIILNAFYVTFRRKNKSIFWITTLLHASYNLYGILFVR